MRKVWTTRELDGLFSLETVDRNLILTVLHNVGHAELAQKWPILANRVSCSTDRGLGVVADQIATACHRTAGSTGLNELPEAILSAYQRRMFAAVDRNDLLLLLYELEDCLRRFPAHPQGRLLHDRVSRAVQYEESALRDQARLEPHAAPSLASRHPWFRPALGAAGLVVLVLGYLAFSVGHVRSFRDAVNTARDLLSRRPTRRIVITTLRDTVRGSDEALIDGRVSGTVDDVAVYVLHRTVGDNSWTVERALVGRDGSWSVYASVPERRRYVWGNGPATLELLALVSGPQLLEQTLGNQSRVDRDCHAKSLKGTSADFGSRSQRRIESQSSREL